MKRVITAEMVASEFAAGRRRIAAPRADTVVTPEAYSKARELGVGFEEEPPAKKGPQTKAEQAAALAEEKGSAERVVDKSGLIVVRGGSVQLGAFQGAGPGRNIGLTDVITGKDGSPMTAGIMSWSREDSFPWSLDYDEVDLVLQGVLQITIDGRTLEGRAGDVFYIPKGSKIIFGTPNRTRVFYVTYPADWAGAAKPLARPQK